MKKLFSILAVALYTIFATAQTNQYFWYNGQLMFGTPISLTDSVTFGEIEYMDSLYIALPQPQIKYVHDTVYVANTNSQNVKQRTKQNQTQQWLTLSDVDVNTIIGDNLSGEYYSSDDLHSYHFSKFRVTFDEKTTLYYSYITIRYSDDNTRALEFSFRSDLYGHYRLHSQSMSEALIEQGTLIEGNTYEFDMNVLCGTVDKEFYVDSWQKNFLPNKVSILTTTDSSKETDKNIDELLILLPRQQTIEIHDTIYIPEESATQGAISGEFSVSPTKKVRFSKGNLQYQASTDTWRFAENQWDYIGENNINISASYSGWIDLFGWGTGNNPTNTSNNSGDYSTFVDWGKNRISNNENNIDEWFTLSGDEWAYLFCERNNANALFGLGNVNGVNGTIVLPDNWVTPSSVSFNASTSNGLYSDGNCFFHNSHYDNFNHNIYTIEQWAVMEDAGAIFLPITATRKEGDIVDLEAGVYWSATPSCDGDAYSLYFTNYYFRPKNSSYSYYKILGLAVRLVQNLDAEKNTNNLAERWSGFIIEGTEDRTIVTFDAIRTTEGIYYDPNITFDCGTLEGNMWYSYDAQTWTEWVCGDSIILYKGQQICLKGNRQKYCILDNGHYRMRITSGAIKGYGYISSLFDNGDQYTTTSFGDNALSNFFEGNCSIDLSFPEGVAEIGTTYIFSYSFALHHQEESPMLEYGYTSIKLPSTLRTLGCTCFENAAIQEITIPRSVTYIGNAAFNRCQELETVNFLGTIEEWDAIEKGDYKWDSYPPAAVVHCIDGDAPF